MSCIIYRIFSEAHRGAGLSVGLALNQIVCITEDIFTKSLKRLLFTRYVLCTFQMLSANILRAALHSKHLDESGPSGLYIQREDFNAVQADCGWQLSLPSAFLAN